MRMKWKIIIPTSCILAVLVIAITVFSTIRFTGFTGILFYERVAVAANGLKKFLADCEYDSRLAVVNALIDSNIVNAINTRDIDEMNRLLSNTLDLYHVDFFVVTDENGIVLARTMVPNRTGDSIADQMNIQEALKGNIQTFIEEGSYVKVSIRTGAPVYDNEGKLTGVLSAGFRFDTDEVLDKLKDHYNADFTVFMHDTRIATTIYSNGERIIGTNIEPDLLKEVYSGKKEYFGNDNVLGENYSTYYLPLMNSNGEIFAVIGAGYSNNKLISERNAMQASVAITGLIGLVFAITMLLLISSGIVRPVNRLAGLVSEITKGNTNVKIDKSGIADDEIGILTLDIYSLIDVIKSILKDLSFLTDNLNKFGTVDLCIDTEKYSGSYREIIEGIKRLADSITLMRQTMAVMDYLDTMISVVDFNYNLLYVNRSMADTYHMESDCIGKKCYKAIRGLDQPCPICQMGILLPDRAANPFINYDSLYDDTAEIYLGGRAAIIRWVDGAQVFFNSISDKTQTIKYQEQLRKTMLEAEAASVAKSAFLANMSHEIRTPMNSIVGFAELAQYSEVTPITREYLNLIKENSDWLLQIINDILDISKVESGNMQFEIIPFNLHQLLNSCKNILQPRAVEKKISLQFLDESPTGKKLQGDPTKLRQVLLNLLSNAVKFTDSGSVVFSVNVKSETDEMISLHFKIKDSGIGMTPDQISRIFEPFMQADLSTTRKYGGTGLGLAITKNLIDMMGSELVIESMPGRGTSIDFELTFKTTEADADDNEAVTEHDSGELKMPLFRGEVLVCEDNQMNQRVITEHLGRVGLIAEIAENGIEGIEKVRSRMEKGIKPYDLIFMDIHMPVMDGIAAAPKIIELGTKTPIIAMTANVMSDEMEAYKSAGMIDSLGKPFTSQELWSCLLNHLEPLSMNRHEPGPAEKTSDAELLKELKADFLKRNKTRVEEIKNAIETGNLKTAYRIAHTLKSNAGLIKMSALQNAAAAVEAALKGEENRLTGEQLNTLQHELSAVLDELEISYSRTKVRVQKNTVYNEDEVAGLLDKLQPLLDSGNTECLKLIDELRAIPGSGELIRQMEDFYFEAAAKELSVLRENLKKIKTEGSEIQTNELFGRRSRLADAVYKTIGMFSSMSGKTSEETLNSGFFAIADAIDLDRIIIFRQTEVDGALLLKQIYRWNRDGGGLTNTSFNFLPNTQIIRDWHNTLIQDICINLKLSEMNEDQREFMNMFGIKSILMVPIIMYGKFLGCVLFQDHRKERHFNDDCMDLVRSFARLCANSVLYTEIEREAAEQNDLNHTIFSASPIGMAMFDENMNITDCNEAMLDLFGVTKEFFIGHFFELSPEKQPDGSNSRDSALSFFRRILDGERLTVNWMHCTTSGAPIPCEITMTRTIQNGKYMGLAFIRFRK